MDNLVGTCQKQSNVWNKIFENRLIAKYHQIPNTWTDCKIFEFRYGNTKLLGNTEHNQVKLVLAVFVSACLYQYSIKLY